MCSSVMLPQKCDLTCAHTPGVTKVRGKKKKVHRYYGGVFFLQCYTLHAPCFIFRILHHSPQKVCPWLVEGWKISVLSQVTTGCDITGGQKILSSLLIYITQII